MDVTHAITKVYVTERDERDDDIKRHSSVITIWRTSAIKMTALFKKNLRTEMKGVQEKTLSWVWGVDRKIRPSRSQSGIIR